MNELISMKFDKQFKMECGENGELSGRSGRNNARHKNE